LEKKKDNYLLRLFSEKAIHIAFFILKFYAINRILLNCLIKCGKLILIVFRSVFVLQKRVFLAAKLKIHFIICGLAGRFMTD